MPQLGKDKVCTSPPSFNSPYHAFYLFFIAPTNQPDINKGKFNLTAKTTTQASTQKMSENQQGKQFIQIMVGVDMLTN